MRVVIKHVRFYEFELKDVDQFESKSNELLDSLPRHEFLVDGHHEAQLLIGDAEPQWDCDCAEEEEEYW